MDIAITWNVAQARGDWTFSDGNLALDSALRSAVLVSLFTDRVAPEIITPLDGAVGFTPAPGAAGSQLNDRRGWWADAWEAVPIGSRLWQLARAVKAGQSTIPREVEAICQEALQWLVDDGVAASVTVSAWWSTENRQAVEFRVSVIEPGQTEAQVFLFSWAWDGL
ncbi:MAG: phage GP46 family protein [Acetobacter sp.]|uniref:phage GP46 family protein n=1 Tax=Acetobacter sp. TaxID=440 RepID=UPI0039EB65D9